MWGQGVVDAGLPQRRQQPWEVAGEGVLQPLSLCQQSPTPDQASPKNTLWASCEILDPHLLSGVPSLHAQLQAAAARHSPASPAWQMGGDLGAMCHPPLVAPAPQQRTITAKSCQGAGSAAPQPHRRLLGGCVALGCPPIPRVVPMLA